MRRICISISIIVAVVALVLAVTAHFSKAFLPVTIALIFGLIALYMTKKEDLSKKSIYLSFLLTGIALMLTTYKLIFYPDVIEGTKKIDVEETSDISKPPETLEELEADDQYLYRHQ